MNTSKGEQYVVNEKGNATAVILPIESYKKILAILEEFENHKETKILSQSVEFKKLVKKGLEDIKLDRIKPWKEVWDELEGLFDRNLPEVHENTEKEISEG